MVSTFDDSHRIHQSLGSTTFTHNSTLRQHVCRRDGNGHFSLAHVSGIAGDFHGAACIRCILTSVYFHAAHSDLRQRSSRSRTLMALSVPSVSPPSPRADWEPPPREQIYIRR